MQRKSRKCLVFWSKRWEKKVGGSVASSTVEEERREEVSGGGNPIIFTYPQLFQYPSARNFAIHVNKEV